MAPQTTIPLAATILGTIGTIFWCIQLLPQIWYNWKHKKTEGLPGLMMFLWAISAVPFGVYAIIQNFNLPIQIQPQIFCTLSLVAWGQILHYSARFSALRATLTALSVGVVFAAVEMVLILTLRPLYDRGVNWPLILVGIVAAILLALGLLPPYGELWKRGGRVVGIHFGFLTVDWLGAFFSLLGVAAQETFDPLGGSLFIVCLVIEGGIFMSHGIWLFRTRKVRAVAKAAGTCFDELPESERYHVDVMRKGSIAADRDLDHVEIERRGSVPLVTQDLELGVAIRNMAIAESFDELGIGKSKKDVVVRVEEVRPSIEGEGVSEIDYGTMSKKDDGRKRPGFLRRDTGGSLFPGKEPDWGSKK